MREPHHPSCAELELPAVLHALSDPARLQIVRQLSIGDECTCGTFDLGLSKATLSHHFRVLRESGVVRTRPEGRTRMLSLRKAELDERFPGLLDAVLSAEPPKPVEVRSNGATASAA
jgi:DNA-binding transcriptional ArsR family regulator